MKKAITLTLIAILFLALFAGCNTYSRPMADGTVDGGRVTRGFQYRHDGYVTDGRTTRDVRTHYDNYRYDGHMTGHDGMTGTTAGRTDGIGLPSGTRTVRAPVARAASQSAAQVTQ